LAAITALAVVVLDQITKIWAVAALEEAPFVIVDEFFRLAIARNPGASFSMFTGSGQWIGLIAVAVIVGVFVLVDRVDHRIDVIGLGLIMGGAAGNLMDRIFRGDGFLDGAVVDFIDFDFFPSFNVADMAINIGVGLILIGTFIVHRNRPEPDADVEHLGTDDGEASTLDSFEPDA
jgi:signal peptidase II